jgi:hypothetical protein
MLVNDIAGIITALAQVSPTLKLATMYLANPDLALIPVVCSSMQFLMQILLHLYLQASQTTKQLAFQ